MPTGTAELVFPAGVGDEIATAVITGQTGIAANAHIEAWIQGDTTADHNEWSHLVLAGLVSVTPMTVVPDVGFTIVALADLSVSGTVRVHWVWINP